MTYLRRLIIIPALAVSLAAGACTWRDGFVVLGEPQLPVPPKTQVGWAEVQHMVAFEPGKSDFDRREVDRLEGFLLSADLGYGDRVVLTAAPEAPLADQRVEAVRHYLQHQGIATAIASRPQAPIGRDEVEISVGRYQAVLPECQSWDHVLSGGGMTGGREKHGCVTASARGAHVADPGDLLGGGPVGPGDGDKLARSVRDYRTGKSEGDAAKQSIRFVVE